MSNLYSVKMGNPIQQTEADLERVRDMFFTRAWSKNPEALINRDDARRLLKDVIVETGGSLNLVDALLKDIYGFGPLTELKDDPDVSDIWVDGYNSVWYEKDGRLFEWHKTFMSEDHLRRFVTRLVASTGRKVDEAKPIEDFRLLDGSRGVVFLSGVSVRGTCLVIRKFTRLFTLEELAERKLFPPHLVRLLKLLVKARINIFVGGALGAGKNTLMNAMLLCVDKTERLAFVEDPAETRVGLADPKRPDLPRPRTVVFEPRRAGIEGEGEVPMGLIFEKILRSKPSRVICSECRDEVTTYWTLQAMNIGLHGSISSVHVESPREVAVRLSDMLAGYKGGAYSSLASRAGAVAAAELVIYLGQINGHRRMLDICEIRRENQPGAFPNVIPLYTFQNAGFGEDNEPLGELVPTGEIPLFLNKRKVEMLLTPEELEELRGFFNAKY
ncbi:MAG: CpaF family protein [Bacillota bacterium]